MNIRSHFKAILFLLFCALIGCQTDEPVEFNYAYEVDKYYGDPVDHKNYRSTSY